MTPNKPAEPQDEIDKILEPYRSVLCSGAKLTSYGFEQFTAALKARERRLVLEGRLVELYLLEQAINQGRDMNEYKLLRLAELTRRLEETK